MKIDAEVDASSLEIQGTTVISPDRTLAVVGLSTDAESNACAGAGGLAATATAGFFYLPDTSGAPAGIPAAKPGFSPLCYDPTDHKLWVYDSLAETWRGVALQ